MVAKNSLELQRLAAMDASTVMTATAVGIATCTGWILTVTVVVHQVQVHVNVHNQPGMCQTTKTVMRSMQPPISVLQRFVMVATPTAMATYHLTSMMMTTMAG
jgi:hypothetical protein